MKSFTTQLPAFPERLGGVACRAGCVVLLLMVLSLPLYAQTPAYRQTAAYRAAHKPNLDLYVYRRSYTPDEKLSLRLSAYNEAGVRFTVYRVDLGTLAPSSKVLEDFGKQIRAIDLDHLPVAALWTYGLTQTYKDQWAERAVKVPHLPPGVYVVRASGGGAEKRTWFAITDIALLAKQSRQELLVYATQVHSGRPVAGLRLAVTDARGHRGAGATDTNGILRIPKNGVEGSIWLSGEQQGQPAFILSGPPPAPDPFTIYTTTDRPIYRPRHKVQFQGTVRERLEAAAPGGFVYRPYADKRVRVEIRDATDALIQQTFVTTNQYGTFDGTLQLAAEPTLGHWQIVVGIGDFRTYGGFEVQAYRKPEFTTDIRFDKPHYIGGSVVPAVINAQYYFGQPVVNAPVHYSISFSGGEPPYEGNGTTDAKGHLTLEIKTQRQPFDRTLSVTATVTDLSRRTQSATGDTVIQGGLFHLSISTDKQVYHPNERVLTTVHAEDYDGKPVAAKVRVRLIETKYDRDHRPYQEITTRDVETNAAGNAATPFHPARPGYLQLAAQAFDGDDHKITAEGYVWVAGEDYPDYAYPTLNVIADRTAYRPGETATILLNTSLVTPKGTVVPQPKNKNQSQRPTYPEAWALVTIEGERLYKHEVIHLTSRSTVLHVPLNENDFPSVQVNVTIIQEKQVYAQDLPLEVLRDNQRLKVSVTPDKDKWTPGEAASYTVTTRDYKGRPVPAEVALGVVDASIYAIQPDNAPDMEDYFYGGQQVRVQTDFSFSAQYSGGAYQTVPSPAPGAGKPGAIRVRRQFADTAYWNPYVMTDAGGTAKVTFTMPDNLTTWRATARGITGGTAVGVASQDTVSTMPLLVRLELPRFYVQGDRTIVSAIVHNYTGVPRTITTKIEATGATLAGDATRTLQLGGSDEQRVEWTAHITDTAHARFLVVADGGAGAQDATELTLPVSPDGLKMVDAQADTLNADSGQFEQDLSQLPPGATVTLTLAPSLASSVVDALDYLQAYPYGCAEQTASSFLPDIIVTRTWQRLKVAHAVNPDLTQWVNLGLQKLYRYQHGDGGWNWWEFDQTDGDMTSYVLYALLQAKEAGYTVDDQRILRGTEALLRMLNNEQELSKRADWLLTLSYARPQVIAQPLAELYSKRRKLDVYGQASLCLALSQEGGKFRPMAAILAHELAARAVPQGRLAHWTDEEGGYSWHSDDVDVTAHVLRAVLTAMPQTPLAPSVVRWLMSKRVGKAWQSTHTSADVVFALTQFLEQTRELQPNFTARVALDGVPQKDFLSTAATVFDAPTTLTFTPEQLKGHTSLTVNKQGVGVLYTTTLSTYILPPEQARPFSRGITVQRFYRVTTEDPSQADTQISGQNMDVQVNVTSDDNYRYAILEEPIPAGCEVGAGDDGPDYSGYASFEDGGGGYVRKEVRDNKVVFFFDELPKGRTHLTYTLHMETPGIYHILPSLASLVYFPEVRGNDGLALTKIKDITP